tara:strand:+ start:3974 stop:4753 length:780 start_codon:yes stop_codon:yes gene_type:complete
MGKLKVRIPDLKEFLDEKAYKYESPSFIKDDPILIPHEFKKREDIEISAFITSVISWGNRKTIIKSSRKIMGYMENSPYDFVMNHNKKDLLDNNKSIHRTFNMTDLNYFIISLKNIYKNYGGIEDIISNKKNGVNIQERISFFKKIFFTLEHPKRTLKHLPSPMDGSSAKRFNMFLRWMVRSNEKGVDFGIWKKIKKSELSIPLDVHTGRISRDLGILSRKQNDSKSVNEIDKRLREMDPIDPVKYDYALFGLGVYEKF